MHTFTSQNLLYSSVQLTWKKRNTARPVNRWISGPTPPQLINTTILNANALYRHQQRPQLTACKKVAHPSKCAATRMTMQAKKIPNICP